MNIDDIPTITAPRNLDDIPTTTGYKNQIITSVGHANNLGNSILSNLWDATTFPALNKIYNEIKIPNKTPGQVGQLVQDVAGYPLKLATAPIAAITAPLSAAVTQIPAVSQSLQSAGNAINTFDTEKLGGHGDTQRAIEALADISALGLGKIIPKTENIPGELNPVFEKQVPIPNVAQGLKNSETNNAVGRAQAIVDGAAGNLDKVGKEVYAPANEKLKAVKSYANFGKDITADLNSFLDQQENVNPALIDKYKKFITENIDTKATTPYLANQKRQALDDIIAGDFKDNAIAASKAERIGTNLRNIVNQHVDAQILQSAPGFLPEWQEANAFYAKVKSGFDFADKLNKDTTTGLSQAVSNLKPENIQALKNTAGDEPVKGMGYQIIDDTLRPKEGIKPADLKYLVKKWENVITPEGLELPGTGESIFGPQEWQEIKNFSNAVTYYHNPGGILSSVLGKIAENSPVISLAPAATKIIAKKGIENAINTGVINLPAFNIGPAAQQSLITIPEQLSAIYNAQNQ